MSRFLRAASLAAALGPGAGPGLVLPAAAEPLSAIPWLSDALAGVERPQDPGGARIETTPLDAPRRMGAGLIGPADSGLPADLWGSTSALRARGLLGRIGEGGVPAMRGLLHTLLVAQLTEPRGSGPEKVFLRTRIDRLLAMGALEEAYEILSLSGDDSPETLERLFDVALLTGAEHRACAMLLGSAEIEPTAAARIFCLAREGDWRGAVLSLAVARESGRIDPVLAGLLARFLETEETLPDTPVEVPRPVTPLVHVMLLAIGAGGATSADSGLPVAFAHLDLARNAPPRARMLAAERLVAAGGLSYPVLFAAYRGVRPAASGGVWSRAEAVQALDAALADGHGIGPALETAREALAPLGLEVALGREYAPVLSALPPDPVLPARLLARLLLLGGETRAAARWTDVGAPPGQTAALTLLSGEAVPDAGGLLGPALERAFSEAGPDGPRAAGLAALIADGRPGEALLRALALLDAGTGVDPDDLAAALFALRALGQEETARRIAAETLLLARAD